MAKQVIWSLRAQVDRKEILGYWTAHNQSSAYSKKLNALIKDAVSLIKRFPRIGRPTDFENVRAKVVRDYLLFYEETENHIIILTIWNTRRNPNDLTQILK